MQGPCGPAARLPAAGSRDPCTGGSIADPSPPVRVRDLRTPIPATSRTLATRRSTIRAIRIASSPVPSSSEETVQVINGHGRLRLRRRRASLSHGATVIGAVSRVSESDLPGPAAESEPGPALTPPPPPPAVRLGLLGLGGSRGATESESCLGPPPVTSRQAASPTGRPRRPQHSGSGPAA